LRILRVGISVLVLVCLLVGAVYAVSWNYQYPVTITDTSGNSRTNYPTNLEFGTSALVSSGQIDADGLNTNMQSGATSIPYMLADDRVMTVVPSLSANTTETVNFYTGYDPPQTNFPIVIGEGGYIIVDDDGEGSVIALGTDNFSLTLDGYILDDNSATLFTNSYGDISIKTVNNNLNAEIEVDADKPWLDSEFYNGYVYGVLSNGLLGKLNPSTNELDWYDLGIQTYSTVDSVPRNCMVANGNILYMLGQYRGTTDQAIVEFNMTTDTSTIHDLGRTSASSVYGSLLYANNNFYICEPDGIHMGNTTGWVVTSSVGSSLIDGDTYNFVPQTATLVNGFIYTYGSNVTTALFKVDASDLSVDGYIELAYSMGAGYDGGTITDDGSYLYPIDCDGDQITKVALNTFTGTPVVLTNPAYGTSPYNSALYHDGYIYFGYGTNDSQYAIDKVNTTTLEIDDSLIDINLSEPVYIQSMCIDTANNRIYYQDRYSTCIDRLALNTFTQDYSLFTYDQLYTLTTTFTSGEHNIVLERIGVDYTLYLDSSSVDTVYTGMVGNAFTSGFFYIMGDCAPYLNYFNLNIDGTDVLLYQPNSIIASTSFSGTVDSGTDWSLVDDALTQAAGYWDYARVTITDTTDDLAPKGESLIVSYFDNGLDRLEMDGTFTTAVESGDSYAVTFATIPDLEIGDGQQDGRIAWGVNDNITIGISGGIGGGGDVLPPKPGFNLPNSPLPATWFANCENAANLPFYDSFSEVAFQTGMDLCLLYFMLIIGLAIGSFLLLIMSTRSALLGAVGFNVVLFIGSSMTIVAMWIPFVCLIIMIGIMFLYKQVAY
jgi:hypothetical protein